MSSRRYSDTPDIYLYVKLTADSQKKTCKIGVMSIDVPIARCKGRKSPRNASWPPRIRAKTWTVSPSDNDALVLFLSLFIPFDYHRISKPWLINTAVVRFYYRFTESKITRVTCGLDTTITYLRYVSMVAHRYFRYLFVYDSYLFHSKKTRKTRSNVDRYVNGECSMQRGRKLPRNSGKLDRATWLWTWSVTLDMISDERWSISNNSSALK